MRVNNELIIFKYYVIETHYEDIFQKALFSSL